MADLPQRALDNEVRRLAAPSLPPPADAGGAVGRAEEEDERLGRLARVVEREVIPLYESGRWEEGLALAREILANASPRHQSSDQENRVIRQVTAKWGIPLADVEAAVIAREPHGIPGETLFSDHCHLNEKGNRILMETYLPKIVEALSKRGEDTPGNASAGK